MTKAKQNEIAVGLSEHSRTGGDCYGCPYKNVAFCHHKLCEDALELLKAQEPRLLTKEDFSDNENADYRGALPAWIEHKYEDVYGGSGYWGSWNVDEFDIYDQIRPWTSRPTDEQREATPWN